MHRSLLTEVLSCCVQAKVNGPNIHISKDSVLVIEEGNVEIRSLDLDGTLVVSKSGGGKVTVDGLKVQNAGWKWRALKPDKPMTEEEYIR